MVPGNDGKMTCIVKDDQGKACHMYVVKGDILSGGRGRRMRVCNPALKTREIIENPWEANIFWRFFCLLCPPSGVSVTPKHQGGKEDLGIVLRGSTRGLTIL